MKKTVITALAGVILYNIFFYQAPLGVGVGVLFLLLHGYFLFTRNTQSKNISFGLASSACSILFAFLFAFRANGITQFIDLLSALFFSGTAFYLYKKPKAFSISIAKYVLAPLMAAGEMIVSAVSYTNKDKWNLKPVNKEITGSLIRGIVITVPVFIVLFFLLTQADQVFAALTKQVFGKLGDRFVVSAIIFIGLVVCGITEVRERVIAEMKEKAVALGKAHELAIIIGSIAALFAVFIIIQFRYLFSSVGERELQQLGVVSVTYSEYVRKGFFELLMASALASSIIIYALRYVHRLRDKQKVLVQTLSAVLTLETGLLLFSAAKRLSLYADDHGLTRARVFGFIFLVWLGFMLVTFLVALVKKMNPKQLFFSTFGLTLITLLASNVINIDGLIATKYKPTVNKEIDYFYLSRLSPDAYESWKPAISDAEKTVKQLETVDKLTPEQRRKLYWARETLAFLAVDIGNVINKYDTSVYKWQGFNASEYTAYKHVTKDRASYKKVSTLIEAIDRIEQRDRNNYQYAPLDRSSKPPLTR